LVCHFLFRFLTARGNLFFTERRVLFLFLQNSKLVSKVFKRLRVGDDIRFRLRNLLKFVILIIRQIILL
jgi:hypothetical protein